MSSSLTPQEPALLLKHTNVSSPSVVHRQSSQQSITASEDYYSLSGSDRSANDRSKSQQTITRYQTPPSRYRTPQQSRDHLPYQHAPAEAAAEQQVHRKTPMRGEGKRRQSSEEAHSEPVFGATITPGTIRRKPVPSVVMEGSSEGSPRPISPQNARSSMAQRFSREYNAPTPDVDDRPFIEFALEQLTRDEEVRGSRTYAGYGAGVESERPYAAPIEYPAPRSQPAQPPSRQPYQQIPQEAPQEEDESGDLATRPRPRDPPRTAQPLIPDIAPVVPPSPPEAHRRPQGPNLFVPVALDTVRQPDLRFLPGILRTPALLAFFLVVLLYMTCLIIAAVWSLAKTGLVDYGTFGDGRYFVFKYLPTLLGMIILFWLIQIQTAVFRVAPFIAMTSHLDSRRLRGAQLPLQPKGFVLPYFGHLQAGLPVIGTFVVVAWAQLFTIPLLSSTFNVYFAGAPNTGRFRWIANDGIIWAVVGLYVVLLVSTLALWISLRKTVTGLKWDPRSLADIIAILERSNALEEAAQNEGIARLGLWRDTHRPTDIFHTYGIEGQPARSYAVEDGRIREKARYSDPNADLEAGRPQPKRWSKVAMLHPGSESGAHHGSILPWYLQPSLALLWPVIAIVLLLAFLIVSYLPSTSVLSGFEPMVSVAVNRAGFSSDNFLYSFLPTGLALLCFLFWADIDMAYRRLQPLATLASSTTSPAATAERTLLTSYPADLPILTTLSALFNTHLRVAWTSLITLLSTALPVLAAGAFWAQFSVPRQRTLIFAWPAGYYALTVFVTIYALAYLAIFPPAALRHPDPSFSGPVVSFADHVALLRHSRLLDDIAFRAPRSKTVLVTRLLAGPGAAAVLTPNPAAASSKLSLADSVRGFGRARDGARVGGGAGEKREQQYRFAYGRFLGRDGREWVGIDRVGR